MPEASDAIISIHPGYANAILEGTKTIELRRRIPELATGTRLWIYATRPTAAVVGTATIRDVNRAHPRTIWRKHRDGAGVDHAAFMEYFHGTQEAVAILLAAVRRVGPITIEELRQIRDRFHPPQVLLRLSNSEAKALQQLANK
ncbi:ASCH domain-containing protein [Rhodopseudomonas sp. HC1]|uniref:ASCH domain-containing protein n=1 Tax=Rhodopseudomonas infernalis TaxID=2897386 RepID=UPI001EE944E9|nr:ASCH domain-containing protein [Rhodopseudomonas infernalis]MCG6203063.1 ASCH domain-containing protein [Rhodopseudomonas infernalis]